MNDQKSILRIEVRNLTGSWIPALTIRAFDFTTDTFSSITGTYHNSISFYHLFRIIKLFLTNYQFKKDSCKVAVQPQSYSH